MGGFSRPGTTAGRREEGRGEVPARAGVPRGLSGCGSGPLVLGPAWRPGAGRAWRYAGTAPSLTEEEEDFYTVGLLLGCRRDSPDVWVSAGEVFARRGRR